MPTFTTFSNILPDPVYKITPAGNQDLSAGSPGPGFASVTLTSNKNVQRSRTNSNRGVPIVDKNQYYIINIRYNPMLRDEFDIVDSFISSRSSPFYVVLPQYSKPKDPTFAAYCSSNTISTSAANNAGTEVITIQAGTTILGDPRVNDKFTITDINNINHQKVYSVTRVETNALYQSGTAQPGLNQRRIWISPPLQRFTSVNSVINFIEPKFRVFMSGNIQETELNVDNLYSYSLSLEEIQP